MLRYVHRGVFRTQSNICDSVFCENSLRLISADFFLKKNSLTDVWLVSKYACSFRNSHRHPVEKAVLKNFIIFTGKHLCWLEFLFNKVAGLLPVFGLNTSISLYQYLSVFSLNTEKRSVNLWKRLQHIFSPWILLYSYEQLFWRTSAKRCFCGLLHASCKVVPPKNFILQNLHQKQFVFHFQKWKYCIDKQWIANFPRFKLICKHHLHMAKWEKQKRNKRRKL